MHPSLSAAIVLLSISFVAPASADDKTIVVGARTEPNGHTYEVAFCAREKNAEGQGPGHAFVVLREKNAEGKAVTFKTAGFSPTKTSPIHDGLIKPESYTDPSQNCLIVITNKERFARISESIESQEKIKIGEIEIPAIERYIILINDCVTFMSAVAEEIGLATPPRVAGVLPLSYVEELQEAND